MWYPLIMLAYIGVEPTEAEKRRENWMYGMQFLAFVCAVVIVIWFLFKLARVLSKADRYLGFRIRQNQYRPPPPMNPANPQPPENPFDRMRP